MWGRGYGDTKHVKQGKTKPNKKGNKSRGELRKERKKKQNRYMIETYFTASCEYLQKIAATVLLYCIPVEELRTYSLDGAL